MYLYKNIASIVKRGYNVLIHPKRICYLRNHIAEQPSITVVYFEPDDRKAGGAYLEYTGVIKKVRPLDCVIVTATNKEIAFSEIVSLSGELFRPFENIPE